jgi:hypothetical protein
VFGYCTGFTYLAFNLICLIYVCLVVFIKDNVPVDNLFIYECRDTEFVYSQMENFTEGFL